jgi:hypothetical protein
VVTVDWHHSLSWRFSDMAATTVGGKAEVALLGRHAVFVKVSGWRPHDGVATWKRLTADAVAERRGVERVVM